MNPTVKRRDAFSPSVCELMNEYCAMLDRNRKRIAAELYF